MADKNNLAQYLQRNDRWHHLADIKAGVPGVPDRTLRRWLGDLVGQDVVQRTGSLKGTRYRWQPMVPPEWSIGEPNIDRVFSPANERLLARGDAPLYTRPPVTYSEEWVHSYTPNQSFYLSSVQRTRLQTQGKRPAIHGLAGTYIQKIYNRLLVDLSYNSARLEGNTYTLADTEQLLFKGVGAAGKLNAERIMILNHQEAIRYLVKNVASLRPDDETIRTLHYLLADSLVAPELAGQIRDDSVAASGTTYSRLEGKERLSRLFTNLLEKARRIDDPFEQSFFLLGHIPYLQAFVDVNKRTARLASIIPLIKNDYVPQSFIDVDKNDYLRAMICFYEFNEAGPLADLYCWSYLRSCQHYDTGMQVIGFDEISALYRVQRRATVAEVVRSMVPPSEIRAYLDAHIPAEIEERHIRKFRQDVMAELEHLDISRIGGLGLTREQLQTWLQLREGSMSRG